MWGQSQDSHLLDVRTRDRRERGPCGLQPPTPPSSTTASLFHLLESHTSVSSEQNPGSQTQRHSWPEGAGGGVKRPASLRACAVSGEAETPGRPWVPPTAHGAAGPHPSAVSGWDCGPIFPASSGFSGEISKRRSPDDITLVQHSTSETGERKSAVGLEEAKLPGWAAWLGATDRL